MLFRRTTYRALTTTSMGALVLLGAGAAFAQAAEPAAAPSASAPAPDGGRGPALSEIVITGERANRFGTDVVQAGSFRGANALDTPLTVSVIPRAVIEVQQARNLQEVLQNTAGVTVSQTSPTVYSNLAIRGINVENRGNYRLNGVLPIINLVDLPLEDKDRVEALKGASALYYGFTTPSGIINMTMKRPTENLYAETDAFGDSNGGVGGHVDFGNTWGMFGARVNGVYAHVDSGIDNSAGTRSLISGAFDFKPAHNLTISFDAEHIFKKVNEPGIWRFVNKPKSTAANPYPSIALPALLDPSTNFGPDWAFNRSEETNLLGVVDWKISRAWDLNVSGGTSRLRRDRHFSTVDPLNINTNAANGEVGEDALAVSYQPNAHYLNRNARIELAGTFDTGPFTHEILVGASINVRDQYSSTSVAESCLYDASGNVLGGWYTGLAVPTGAHTSACRQDPLDPHGIPQLGEPGQAFTATRINDKGAYIFDRIKFHEWLQLLGGARKSDYTESVIGGADTFKSKPWSFSYGAVIKPLRWASLYGTYIEGLESTPAAPTTAVNAGAQLPATKSKQYEGGIKLEPKKGLLFQAAYFSIERAATFVNAANVYVSDGKARYRGLEVSLTGDLTPELSIYSSAQFLSAKQISGQATGTYNGVFVASSVGKFIENTPKHTFSTSLNYKLDRWVSGLSINGGVIYIDRRAVDALNQAWAPGYTLFNVGAGYERRIADHDVIFRINADNITGKRYWASTGADLLAEGAPQVVKFSMTVKF